VPRPLPRQKDIDCFVVIDPDNGPLLHTARASEKEAIKSFRRGGVGSWGWPNYWNEGFRCEPYKLVPNPDVPAAAAPVKGVKNEKAQKS